jgi:phosphohistidine swiveling domain-containing protein
MVTLATSPLPPVPPQPSIDSLRERVPPAHQTEFENLFEDARFTYGLRDENGGITAAWAVGLLRRAMLEAGNRLEACDRLVVAAHAVELDVDDLLALLISGHGPSSNQIADRATARTEMSRERPPSRLGSLPGSRTIAAFPEPLRLMLRSQLALADGSYHRGTQPLTGIGIGTESVTARACVAQDASEALARLHPGDILITSCTNPSFTDALSIAGGLVVEQGGDLSHGAVSARALGLPAVIGVAGAVAAIPDRSLIIVDADVGLVRRIDANALRHT